MKKTIFLVFLLVSTTCLNTQQNEQENEIKKRISVFFEALHKGDSTLMKTVLHKDLKVQTTRNTKEGKSLLITESKRTLLKSISQKKPEDIYFEKLLSYDIKIDGNLASVWTPYEFYFNNKFSHCGANSFQLFKNNGTWEIIFLVDMRRQNDCEAKTIKK